MVISYRSLKSIGPSVNTTFIETLIKHRDPFKFLKMATKLLFTYGGIILISRLRFTEIPMSLK